MRSCLACCRLNPKTLKKTYPASLRNAGASDASERRPRLERRVVGSSKGELNVGSSPSR